MRRLTTLWAVFLCAALLFYWTALGNPPVFDDAQLIAGNDRLSWSEAYRLAGKEYFGFFGRQPVSYRPVNTLTYIVNRSLFDERYAFWRFSYLALHAVNALLLYTALTSSRIAFGRMAVLPSALVFLLHPLHSEIINAVSFSEEIVTAFFLLLALNLLVRAPPASGLRAAAAVGAAYGMALLSKETALFFPAVVLAWAVRDAVRNKDDSRGPSGAAVIFGGTVLVSLAFVALRFFLFVNPAEERSAAAASAGEVLRSYFQLMWDYGVRFCRPRALSALYARGDYGTMNLKVLLGFLLGCALLASAVLLWRRKSSAAIGALWLAAATFYFPYMMAISPPWGLYAYDRYFYVPSIGLAWLMAAGLARLLSRPGRRFPAAAPVWAVLVLWLIFCHSVTQQRNRVWSSSVNLWKDVVAKGPGIGIGHYNLGVALEKTGNAAAARKKYEEALSHGYLQADVYYNLGNLDYDEGNLAAARGYYTTALSHEGEHERAMLNLGNIHFTEGTYPEAIDMYRAVLKLNPRSALAWNNLGQALLRQGQAGEAVGAFREALRLSPGYQAAGRGLSQALARVKADGRNR